MTIISGGLELPGNRLYPAGLARLPISFKKRYFGASPLPSHGGADVRPAGLTTPSDDWIYRNPRDFRGFYEDYCRGIPGLVPFGHLGPERALVPRSSP